jgi:hypothetical protein
LAPTESDDGEGNNATTLCKYYLQGTCRRADCWYAHDPKEVACKYFEQGWCASGADCEFRHDATTPTLREYADWLADMMQHGPEHLLAALDKPSQADPTGFFGAFEPTEGAFPDLASTMGGAPEVVPQGSWQGSTPVVYGQEADVEVRWDGAKQIKWTTLRKMYPAVWEDDLLAVCVRVMGVRRVYV